MRSPAFRRATSLWKHLRSMLARLWRRSQNGSAERQVAKTRARFWAEVREGQREAETHSHLRPPSPGPALGAAERGDTE